MSFIGSINAETRKWLGNKGHAFDGRKVYVGCSGAFTVEQIISRYAPKARMWGNDVSLYSSALGAYLANQSFRLEVQEEKFAWIEPYLADEEAKAAAVMVLFEVLKYEKANNLFKQRHWAHYLNNFQKFHQDTIAKLRERKQEIRLEAYTSRDIYDLLDEMPPDAVAVAFLPTYAGGYERMFKRLEEIFAWDRPEYGMIDADRKVAILEKMKTRDYLFLDDKVWEDLPQVAVVRKARMKPVYIYSNMAALRLGVMKQQRHAEFVPFARLSDADEITPESKVTVTPTTNRVVNYLSGCLPVQRCGHPGGRRGAVCGGGGRQGLRLPDLHPDAGGRRHVPPGRLRGQLHALPAPGQAPAAGDPDPGSAPAHGRKITVGDSQVPDHGVHRQAGVHEIPGAVQAGPAGPGQAGL